MSSYESINLVILPPLLIIPPPLSLLNKYNLSRYISTHINIVYVLTVIESKKLFVAERINKQIVYLRYQTNDSTADDWQAWIQILETTY